MLTESRVTTAPGLGSGFFAGSPLPRSRKNQAAPATRATSSGTTTSIFLDFLAGPPSPAAAPAAPAGAGGGGGGGGKVRSLGLLGDRAPQGGGFGGVFGAGG